MAMASVTPAGSAPPRKRRGITHVGTLGMLLGAVLLIVGAFAPWVSTPLGHLWGIAGPGLWVLCAGTIAAAGALLPYPRVALLHAAAVLVVWQLGRIIQLSATTDTWGSMLPGMGLVLVGGGAVVLLRAALRIRAAT